MRTIQREEVEVSGGASVIDLPVLVNPHQVFSFRTLSMLKVVSWAVQEEQRIDDLR